LDLEDLVRQVVEASGERELELAEADLVREQGRRILRVSIDREGGVDLDTIARVSERLSRRLDLEGFDPGPYTLEVGSPGVERPLRRPRDFQRRVGELVKVKTAEPVEGSRTLHGTLVAADDHGVRIATDAGERAVPYEGIRSARTVFAWGGGRGGKR
jgi:ribosome maturation factor RimP